MPADIDKDFDAPSETSGERDKDRERDRERGPKSKGSTKTKDLSHVPCKFFKVGSCTAGASCPFSHNVLEPGQAKEVCAWFVKGNCKFGHKCALAHILPGQSMAMDRKNKKAAQLAANTNSSGGGSRESSRGGRQKGGGHGGSGSGGRSGLLSGSTAPTRAFSGASRPMPLKATLSPPTPAPPVKDTDFVSFDLSDEPNTLSVAPAQGKSPLASESPEQPVDASETTDEAVAAQAEEAQADENPASSPIPMGTPTAPRRVGQSSPSTVDFGPIGSPPHASPHATRVNGFSPGTSPQNAGIPASPFSAPGTQTIFAINEPEDQIRGFAGRSALSTSLGAMNWPGEGRLGGRRSNGVAASSMAAEVVVEDEDLEDFLPSSLNDLLTPEERSRRLSRSNGVRPDMMLGAQRPTESRHHHSRSVPAPSLLKDIKSIWADDATQLPGSPGLSTSALNGGLGNGTPSSFRSNTGLPAVDDFLSPSNASAAFLPGLQQQYLNAKSSRSNLLAGSSMYPAAPANLPQPMYSNSYGAGLHGAALSPPRTDAFAGRPALDSQTSEPYFSQLSQRPIAGRPIPGGNAFAPEDERRSALSPSARALQAHAPGQSLPQGLAAGYSRIHALPPPVIASPSTPGAFNLGNGGYSPGTKVLGHSHAPSSDWHSASPGAPSTLENLAVNGGAPGGNGLGGLEAMFSRLSYSAATSRGGATPGIGSRVPSGRGYAQGTLSPLSRPVMTEDDDLFSMDG